MLNTGIPTFGICLGHQLTALAAGAKTLSLIHIWLTLHGQPGNEGERLYETPSGLMNSIGLQNRCV